MCAYDTTVVETVDPKSSEGPLPICLRRDNLTSKYFPQTSRAVFAACLAVCMIFLFTSFYRLHHTDLWGHLNFGRWMSEHGQLPAGDPFSINGLERGSVTTSWLSQWVGYQVVTTVGLEGLAFGHALLVAAGCALLILAIRQRGAGLPWATAGAVVAYVLAIPIVGAIRPQMFAMVGVPLCLLAAAYIPAKRHPLIWLPLLFACWANLHGSFAIGLVIIAITCWQASWRLRAESENWKTTLSDARFARTWLTLVAAIAGCCLNPLGIKLLSHVATFGGNAVLVDITEWRPMTIRSLSGVLFAITLLITAVLLRFSDRRIQWSDVLFTLLFGLAAASSMRMLIWWALVWPWVVAPHAAAAWQRWRSQVGDQLEDTPREASMRTLIAIGVVFLTLLLSPPTHSFINSKPRGVAQVLSTETPIFVAEEMQRRRAEGRFFAPMDWADYVIWNNPDRLQPLVYTHVHLMKPTVWRHYTDLAHGHTRWLDIVRHYQLDYLVVSRQRQQKLQQLILRDSRGARPHTRIVYQDQQAMLVEVLKQEPSKQPAAPAKTLP